MKLYPAKSFDINSIMAIERSAFIPQIQEKQKTFHVARFPFSESEAGAVC